jgi:hypothetical protein
VLLAASPADAKVPARWARLSDRMAASWPKQQESSGRYRNWLGGGTRYGEAMMGYGQLLVGLRTGKKAYVRSGLRAITWSATRREGYWSRESALENFAMASAYNLARRSLSRDPAFRRVKRSWEAFLRRVTPVGDFFYRRGDRFSNHYVIESAGMLELLRTGLRSDRPLAALGGARGRAASGARWMLLRYVPSYVARTGGILSDKPDAPLAYQGLSIGFYARALQLLGKSATGRARAALDRAVRTSWLLTAPDGDGGFFGRSMEEGWSLAGAAYAAEEAARLPGSSGGWDTRFRALTERALFRLRDVHGVGANGLFVVPSLRQGKLGKRAVDGTPATSFAGLALVLTEWNLRAMAPGGRRAGILASDRPVRAQLGVGEGRFAVVRRGKVWFAVRRTRSVDRANDLRYDFGLVAFKAPAGGVWRDVLRVRPRVTSGRDTAGPVLRAGSAAGLPFGERMSVSRKGVVTIVGGFRTAGGSVLRRGVRFTYAPVGGCVRGTVAARRGDRIEESYFLRTKPRRSSTSLVDGDQELTASQPFTAAIGGRYTSAIDVKLDRARLGFVARRNGGLAVTVCPA